MVDFSLFCLFYLLILSLLAVFYMLLEPGVNCQEVSSDHASLASNCNAIVTHASDSDGSDSMGRMAFGYATDVTPKSSGHMQQHRQSTTTQMNRFASHSPPSPSSPPTNNRNGGFFIEI